MANHAWRRPVWRGRPAKQRRCRTCGIWETNRSRAERCAGLWENGRRPAQWIPLGTESSYDDIP